MSERELLHAWKQDDESLRLYRYEAGDLALVITSGDGEQIRHVVNMSPAIATSVGRMLVRKTVGK